MCNETSEKHSTASFPQIFRIFLRQAINRKYFSERFLDQQKKKLLSIKYICELQNGSPVICIKLQTHEITSQIFCDIFMQNVAGSQEVST